MTKTKLPRGLRNNNPLNNLHSASHWQGARVEQTDKAFVQFTSMTMGYRAAWRILETYYITNTLRRNTNPSRPVTLFTDGHHRMRMTQRRT